ncbi:anti-sigma factor [Rhizobium sp. L1K21]|uniref:anti-sigma factor family protein n=1 Tax=Rhizobium sp. L1K21 TaxID=2954933 RepID=UPI002091FB36|nr:anti-sigma factor [Rhizobium sp. L1K21]MCO6185716.1 anti-sigma factor [Rhizobium sp. L1K21]
MNDKPKTVSEYELHAYADDQLAADDMVRVEQWLDAHPEDAERVCRWQEQNIAIRDLYEPYALSRSEDEALLYAGHGKQRLNASKSRQVAAAAALFILGTLTGLSIPSFLGSAATATPIYEQASEAYSLYAPEVRHPVEVWADEKDHLVQWLSKRLGTKITAPDLSADGLSLVGGRLIPAEGSAGALLMYEDKSGERFTVLLARIPENEETAFMFDKRGPIQTLYWMDGPLAFAITGETSRETLRQLADSCYRQFQG